MYISTIKHSFYSLLHRKRPTVWLPATSGDPGGDRPGGLPQRQAGPRLVHGASSAMGLSGREGHHPAMLGYLGYLGEWMGISAGNFCWKFLWF